MRSHACSLDGVWQGVAWHGVRTSFPGAAPLQPACNRQLTLNPAPTLRALFFCRSKSLVDELRPELPERSKKAQVSCNAATGLEGGVARELAKLCSIVKSCPCAPKRPR